MTRFVKQKPKRISMTWQQHFPHNSVPTVVMGSQFFEQIMIMAVTCPPLKKVSHQGIYFVVAPSSF